MKNKGLNKLLENWKVVMLSLLIATTFWLFKDLNKEQNALISYPIEFVFNEDSAVVIDPLPEVVKIDVSSGGWNLFRRTLLFSVTPIKIELDNPADIRYLTRSTMMPIVADQLEGLTINFLLTDTIYIHVERKIAKSVQIKVDSVNLSMANRYRLTSPIIIDPPEVILTGPESIINSLQDEYYVMPNLNGINTDINENVKIPLPFENLMNSIPKKVLVSFEVDEFERNRIYVPLELFNFPDDSSTFLPDSTIIINYTIQKEKNEKFAYSDFGVTLDYNMFNEEDSTIKPILIYYPEMALEISLTPSILKVYFNE